MVYRKHFWILTWAVWLWSREAQAHEKWFYRGEPRPTRWDLLLQAEPAMFLIGTGVALVLVVLLWRWRRGRDIVPGPTYFGADPQRQMAFYGIVPAILGLHIAVPLLVYGVLGKLFSPNNQLEGAWAHWFGLGETFIALSFFYGGFTRLAALLLMATWLSGMFLVGWEPMLENLQYLGYALFFFLAGRGPISVDRLLLPRTEPAGYLLPYAPIALRICVGASLLFVGFTEKLANLPLAESFLQQYPLNFTPWLGIPMSDRTFALCAGSVEVLAGAMILLGVFPRTIILIALLPLNLSLTVFSWQELIGHLPFYGALAFLLVWTPADRELWSAGMTRGSLARHT